MRQWVVIPRCEVTVQIDKETPVRVGYASAADAVTSFLQDAGLSTDGDQPQYKVVSRDVDGVEFAYAARWSPSYRDWAIANVPARVTNVSPVPCTCVEGIAVVFATPGLASRSLLAVANARGPNSPKTNVARSTLEVTPERDALFSTLYGLYVDHVKNEINRLVKEENYSLTWAANNAIMLVPFGFTDSRDTLLPNDLRDHMKGLPVYIVEKNGRRTNIAFNELVKEETFWTVDCQLVQSAEGLVKESKADSTVENIVKALGDIAQQLPQGTILYNMDVSAMLRDSVEYEFEPIRINVSESLRRADIHWTIKTANKWIRVQEKLNRRNERSGTQYDERLKQYLDQLATQELREHRRRSGMRFSPLWLAAPDVPFHGNEKYCGISSYYRTFLRGDIEITKFLRALAVEANDDDVWRRLSVFTAVFSSIVDYGTDRVNAAGSKLRRISADLGEEVTEGSDHFLKALSQSPLGLFDTSVWSNRHTSW
jgi:hypothetical protein